MLGRKQVLARAKRIGVADFGVVGDVSAALVAVLDGELSRLVPPARTELNDPAGADPSGLVLTVTLYEILEDPTSRNRPPRAGVERGDDRHPQASDGPAAALPADAMGWRPGHRAAHGRARDAGALRRRDPRRAPAPRWASRQP